MDMADSPNSKAFSGLILFGWISLLVTAVFSARIVYEQTTLTWNDGWQMLGFSMAHLHPGLLVLGMLGALCSHVFLIATLYRVIAARVRHHSVPHTNIVLILAVCLATGLLYIPYQGWMTLIVRIAGPGQHGASYLSFAAAEHHPYLIRTLIDSGVPVDALYNGYTALNAACVVKDVKVGRYLLSRGAELSLAPECEWVSEISGKPKRTQVPATTIQVTP